MDEKKLTEMELRAKALLARFAPKGAEQSSSGPSEGLSTDNPVHRFYLQLRLAAEKLNAERPPHARQIMVPSLKSLETKIVPLFDPRGVDLGLRRLFDLIFTHRRRSWQLEDVQADGSKEYAIVTSGPSWVYCVQLMQDDGATLDELEVVYSRLDAFPAFGIRRMLRFYREAAENDVALLDEFLETIRDDYLALAPVSERGGYLAATLQEVDRLGGIRLWLANQARANDGPSLIERTEACSRRSARRRLVAEFAQYPEREGEYYDNLDRQFSPERTFRRFGGERLG